MASKNVKAILAAYDSFNRRDWDAAGKNVASNATWEDHGRNQTFKSRDEYIDGLQAWATGFSDGKVTDAKAIDAGDTVITQFIGKGTNDGAMGPFQATGRKVNVPFCEVVHFNKEGLIVRGESYFDMLSMLVQLGHAEAPPQ
jgi:steroid delta-isomerase-like uncharacterized protein